MKKIKTKDGLPPEFQLSNYKDLDKLTPQAWLKELNCRVGRYREVEKSDLTISPYPWDFGIISATINARERKAMRDKARTPDQKLVNKINSKSIRLFTIGDVVTLTSCLNRDPEFNNLEKTPYLAPTLQEIFLYDQAIEIHQNQHVLSKGKVPITINLAQSNDELIEEFKLFINAYRNELNIYKPNPLAVPTAKNIKNWIDWKVLQYIDLDLWAKYNKVTVAQNILGDALFSELNSNPSERIRNTVIHNTEKLITALRDNHPGKIHLF